MPTYDPKDSKEDWGKRIRERRHHKYVVDRDLEPNTAAIDYWQFLYTNLQLAKKIILIASNKMQQAEIYDLRSWINVNGMKDH